MHEINKATAELQEEMARRIAQTIINIMVIISNLVGEIGDLCFQAGLGTLQKPFTYVSQGGTRRIGNFGFIELEETWGDEATIINTARISTTRG